MSAGLIIAGAVLQFAGLAFVIAEVQALHAHEYNQVTVWARALARLRGLLRLRRDAIV